MNESIYAVSVLIDLMYTELAFRLERKCVSFPESGETVV